MRKGLWLLLALLVPSGSTWAQYTTPEAILDGWVDSWASYDLGMVDELFYHHPSTSYFSSEIDGLIVGFDRIREHHAGFGFLEGGGEASATLWVDEVTITEVGDSASIAATWHFGDSADEASDQFGPMTMVVSIVDGGYRITHMHFGNYPQE